MKQLAIILAIITSLLQSCHNSNGKIIDDAELLLAGGNIDSALSVISNIYEPERLDTPLMAKYALIIGKVHEYKGEALGEDSLLKVALNYYSNVTPRDSSRLIQATILTAKYHWWRGDKEVAYKLLENTLPENRLAILMQLCELASNDYDYPRLSQYMSQLLDYDNDNGNSDMSFIIRYNYGLMLYYMGNSQAADMALNGIDRYARLPQDTTTYWKLVLRSQADIASDNGDQHRAIELQRKALKHFTGDSTEMSFSYASLSRYYLLKGDANEAEHYLNLANRMATTEIRNDLSSNSYYQILQLLINYAQNRNFSFKDWATYVNRLQDNAIHNRKITDAKEQANRQLAEKNYRITIQSQRQQLMAIYTIIGLIVAITSLVIYLWRKRKLELEKDEEIETLRRMIADSQNSNTDTKDDRFFKRIMLQQLGVIRTAASNPTPANQELLRQMQEIKTDGALLDWQNLYEVINYIYDGYYTHIAEKYQQILNEKELQLCCLLRANFSTKEISIVTGQSVRTVYQRKTQIRQKLGIEEKSDIVSSTLPQ